MNKVKKIVLAIATVIILIRIGYILFGNEIDKEYYTSTIYDLSDTYGIPCNGVSQTFHSNEGRLNSLELIFGDIAYDKVGTITVVISSEDELIYQTNISISNINNWEWKKIFVNAELSTNREYMISFSTSEDCTQIPSILAVKNTWASEIIKSYSNSKEIDGQIAINYGYLQLPGILDKGCMVSLWIWLLLALGLIVFKFDRIEYFAKNIANYAKAQVKPEVLAAVVQIIFSLVITNCSGIEFQMPTKIILYIISLISIVNYRDKKEIIKVYMINAWQKVIFVSVYAFAAFSLVGQRIFIYPLTIKLTSAGMFVYLITFLWFVPVVNSIVYYIEKTSRKAFAESKLKIWHFIFVCTLLLVVPAFYNLFANNPGISSPDTYSCMITQAQHLKGSGDWHPAFYCMIIRAIESVWNSTYAVILVQYFFWTYVCLEMLLYLRKKGFREPILLCIATFLGFNAGNYIHLNTIWKDIPYSLSLFWAVIIIAKLSIDYEYYTQRWYVYLELIIALIGTSQYRKNGIVSYIIIALFLLIALRKNIKIWTAIIISAAMIFIIKVPIYSYLNIQPVENGMYIGLSQDILGVYYSSGEVSEDTLQMINVMTNYNNAEYVYTPTWSNQSYALNIDSPVFIRNYIDTFLKNPIVMTRAIIDREDAIWDIFRGRDSVLGCVNFTGTNDSLEGWNDYYQKRNYVSLYTRANAASTYTANSQWISAIEWRCGLFTLLGIILFAFLIVSKRVNKNIVIISPIIGHILSLLLSTGWSDYRYFWPLNLMNLALILFVILEKKIEDKKDTE